jgi:DNA-directed RNA polymerase specialized sigma24 family protein
MPQRTVEEATAAVTGPTSQVVQDGGMTDPSAPPGSPATLADTQQRFAEALPEVQRLATLQHRRLSGAQQEDAVAETVALAWKNYQRLALSGRDPQPLLPSIVRYAAGHVRAGKLLGRNEPRDVLSRLSREQGGYSVGHLPQADGEPAAAEIRDALRSRSSGPAAEAIARLDWQAFLQTLSPTQRQVAEGLAEGLNLSDIASQRGVSKAAVQQAVARLRRDYDAFRGADRSR